jgi:hypothetical protein
MIRHKIREENRKEEKMFPQLLQIVFDRINIEKYYLSGGCSTQVTIHLDYERLF